MPATPVARIAAAALLATACADSPEAGLPGYPLTVRDSAGVEIVEIAGSVWSAPTRWEAASEPDLRIGAIDGDEPYLFDGIVGLTVLSDGRIVVADAGSTTIRWFDAGGGFLFQRGGDGEGPGEFSRIASLTRTTADSIAVVDGRARRITTFSPEGELGRIQPIAGLPGSPSRALPLADGSFVVAVSGFSSEQVSGDVVPGIRRFTGPIVRVSGMPPVADTLGMFPGDEVDIQSRGGGMAFGLNPMGRRRHLAMHGGRLVMGLADRFQLDFHDMEGSLVRTLRVPDEDFTFTPEMADAYKDFSRARQRDPTPEQRARLEQTLEEMEFPAQFPAYAGLLVDPEDRIWVQQYSPPGTARARWAVFTADGEFTGIATCPDGFTMLSVAGDRIVGRILDDFGVQYVVGYRLMEVDP